MKLLHISDLHLGKTVHEFSMVADQEYILKEILKIADDEQPQAVLMAGDVFDRTIAPAEALRILDDFLNGLVERRIKVFMISGNHDSADRLSFGAKLIQKSGVHIGGVYRGRTERLCMTDEFGEIYIHMLPFLKPMQVRRYFPEVEPDDFTGAIGKTISQMEVETGKRNILLAHQFVTGSETSGSEEIYVGGAENVDAELFAPFDYVALGHLHRSQSVGSETIRYCGTPLKYSFSEASHHKSVTLVQLEEKGSIEVRTVPLIPKRDMCEIRGLYMEVTARAFYEHINTDDYMHITLTDEADQPDAVGKLRVIYPNLMCLDYDNIRTRDGGQISHDSSISPDTPLELFEHFYNEQNGQPVSDIQRSYLKDCFEKVWEGEK